MYTGIQNRQQDNVENNIFALILINALIVLLLQLLFTNNTQPRTNGMIIPKQWESDNKNPFQKN